MLKKLLSFFFTLLLLLAGFGFYAYQKLEAFGQQIVYPPEDKFLVVEKGTSSLKLANLLAEKGIIKEHSDWLPYFIRLKPEYSKFRAGVYSLDNIQTVQDLLAHLNSGKEVQLSVQFIEGRTFKNWQEQLAKAPYLDQTQAGRSEAELAKALGIAHEKIEGWLAPDTYSYVPHTSDLALLKRAYQKQLKTLEEAWAKRADNLPLANPYEMLILASIVEKETGLAHERAQVASVFINRLRLKMKLQTDPTVIYGMGDRYDGNIRKKDLQEATAYNTYVIDGLPPTPIAMPSAASIQAVAQPAQTDFLYFVADGTGGHKFSRTLAEHNRAVQAYLKWYRENNKAK
ncbi:cell division protein YceG [Pasteurellaceae bacterium RH1A]|nr:cell division protein YceG [Pasteurellaceae bacterium RH1A]